VSGSYQGELSTGGTWDALLEAALRGTFATSFVLTSAQMTSITVAPTTITATGGSWLTQNVRIGDMFKLTVSANSANNNKWFRVSNVTATVITVAGTAPLTSQAVDATFSMTVAKTLICGATPTERYFTFEENGLDIDAGPVFTDCKITRLEINCQPNQPISITIGIMGLNGSSASGVSAPTFTTPTYTTTLPLVMSDGTIRINGVDYSVLTGFSLQWDLGGQTPGVLAPTAPDVFLSNAQLSGTFSLMRADMTMFDAFNNETQFDIFVVCSENTVDPKAFVSLYAGNLTLSGNSAPFGQDGALTETVPWNAGKDEAGGARAATTLKISTG
jgi:hypothetical protein